MAINLGNFGQQIAQAGATGVVRSVNPLGGGAAGAFDQIAAQNQQLENESIRARAANSSIAYQNTLADLHTKVKDGMASGEIKPEAAVKSFADLAKQARDDLLDGMDDKEQRVLSPVLDGLALHGEGQAQANQHAFVTDGIKAQLEGSMSGLEKMAITNPDMAIEQANILLKTQGARAGISQADQQATFDKFASTTQYQSASLQVQGTENIGELKKQRTGLSDPGTMKYLNASHRAALMNTIDSRIRELDVRHKMQKAESLGAAREVASVYLDAARQGRTVSPDLQLAAQDAKKVIRGTPAGDAVADAIDGATAAYDQTSRLHGMTFDAQQNKVQELGVLLSRESDPHKAAQLESVSSIVGAAVAKNIATYKADPFAYLEKATGESVAPLDISQDLSTQLVMRSKMAAQLSGITGLPSGLLRPAEAANIKAHLDVLPVDSQLTLLSSIYTAAPTTAQYTMAQIGKEKPIYSAIGMLASKPETAGAARLMARGNQLEGAGGNDPAMKTAPGFDNLIAGQWQKDMGGFFTGNSAAASSALAFTRSTYMALAERDGKTFLGDEMIDRKRWNEAVAIATGSAPDFKYNGYRVIPPYGMPEDIFAAKAKSALNKTLSGMQDAGKRADLIDDAKLVLGSKSGEYIAIHGATPFATIMVTP